MLIMVAGPYNAPTGAERQRNLDRINAAARAVLARGHIPVVGVNAALPISGEYDSIMRIALALAERCDAILALGTSKGVEMEKAIFAAKGLPVYGSLDQLPAP